MRNEPSSEIIKSAFQKAPAAVQEALGDTGIATEFVFSLRERFGLPIDKLAPAAELVRDMLIGLATPAEFNTEMTMFVGEKDKAALIAAALNKEVMEKLRKKEITKGTAPALSPSTSPLIDKPLTTPAQPIVQEPVQPGAPKPAQAAAAAPIIAQQGPSLRTMATDMQAAKDHKPAMPHPYTPSVANLPPAPVVAPPPAPPKSSAPIAPRVQTPSSVPGAPVVKDYGNDPYREPVE